MSALNGLVFSPLLPGPLFWTLIAASILLTVPGLVRRVRGAWLRVLPLAVLMVFLAGPQLVSETRDPLKDVAVVIVDTSASQRLSGRSGETEDAALDLMDRLHGFDDLETRQVRINDAGVSGTRVAEALQTAFADVPPERRAGAIMLTDGQIHDAAQIVPPNAPVHVLLTGKKDTRDRLIAVAEAPRFGLVATEVSLRLTIEDTGLKDGTPVDLTITRADGVTETRPVPANRETTLDVRLDVAGPNVLELSVPVVEGEVTPINNRIAVSINGVRDRLRVLLVSGRPHVGERVWRNSLKADPAVDLIHFTLLRSPYSEDPTPTSELSLIAFPIHELFEEKLDSFDLIIFDRFTRWGLVPESYLRNVAEAVKNGGAVLLSVGPEFTQPGGLAESPLREILPATPTGRTLNDPFVPALTPDGHRHPVTATLSNGHRRLHPGGAQGAKADANAPGWGPWLRQVELVAPRGHVLMEGLEGRPLLILSKEGKGRVALLSSDTIWLWAKGWQGGGPQGELLKRIAHWAMGEPDLEDDALKADIINDRLYVTHRSLGRVNESVTLTAPDGAETPLPLLEREPGVATGDAPASLPGVYRVTAPNGQSTLAVSGPPNPLETTRVLPTETILSPLVEATGGSIHWLSDHGLPDIRRISARQDSAGTNWIGLRANGAHIVSGVTLTPALPGWLALVLSLGGLCLSWWREGSTASRTARVPP